MTFKLNCYYLLIEKLTAQMMSAMLNVERRIAHCQLAYGFYMIGNRYR